MSKRLSLGIADRLDHEGRKALEAAGMSEASGLSRKLQALKDESEHLERRLAELLEKNKTSQSIILARTRMDAGQVIEQERRRKLT